MEGILFILLIGFAIVLLVHSWLLMGLNQKYHSLEELYSKKKISRPEISNHANQVRQRPNNNIAQKKTDRKNKGRTSQ